ncbi:MAG: hypothetical protein A2087_08430 [Spirochaetes bacterium GWD1_61_31]|nr:MAG: hypothetical protein A2Y37_03405 [Spirochaetes bacterium GWB1_60_80]OHD29653.1 MAG: hypothetical protein A2004_01945 [Spirochaetes bacterium GWC1_61_12]OHD34700.1 MAG: hypothetical protein A2087_08430 [Spirochaetes bacterium GWD1_61_31]OHD41932.1 MAG: hypothetical protein A2Y35_14280 [Spirochaetes bacterium GWE1_60_18]OHD61802.1 MAG: hypothetical protein A2Y32_13665 [Spirochaetes bacterium GWF1_60_12]HAW85161.1 hypothetical protein [Spirochaetaceae bacterium]
MTKRDWLIAGTTSIALLGFLALATLFALYSNGYASAFITERARLAGAGDGDEPASLAAPGRFSFIRQGPILAYLVSGEESLVFSALALEGTYTVYVLRCDANGKVISGLPLYARGDNQLRQAFNQRVAVSSAGDGVTALTGDTITGSVLTGYAGRIWLDLASAAKQATLGLMEVSDGN